MADDLFDRVRSISGTKVLLVGDLILDRYLYGDAERISPEAPVPVLRTVETREAVGGSANVAACLKALGCQVFCCGTIGGDAHGRTLRKLVRVLGVDATGVVEVADRPTTTKTRFVGLAQHRHRQQLLRVDEEDTSPLEQEVVNRLIDTACHRLDDVDVVCIEDYDKGVVTTPLVRAVVERARKKNKAVLVDPARLTDYSRYRDARIVTPNRDELSLVAGAKLDSLEAAVQAAQRVCASHNFSAMIVTMDRDGALLIQKGEKWHHFSTVPRAVYDNTGAGDAVLAMLAAAVGAGADLESAVRLANVSGGLEVEKFGCVPISADEILAELRLEDLGRNGKLRSEDELVSELGLRRDRGETVAFTNGCFDILHAGHVDLLKRARREASVLVVGLNSDASVRAQDKGDDRPVHRFEHRACVLGALECVDYVVGFEEANPESLIRTLRPDVLIKGEDWAGRGVVGAEFVESIGGRVVLFPLLEGLSTTNLIARIRSGA